MLGVIGFIGAVLVDLVDEGTDTGVDALEQLGDVIVCRWRQATHSAAAA